MNSDQTQNSPFGVLRPKGIVIRLKNSPYRIGNEKVKIENKKDQVMETTRLMWIHYDKI